MAHRCRCEPGIALGSGSDRGGSDKRQPSEDGFVAIARAAASVRYPSRLMLAAAMNPCPCGYHGDPRRSCVCAPLVVERYLGRVSGPLLDRIDIHIEVSAVAHQALAGEPSGDSSQAIRERVTAARGRQLERFAQRPGVYANAHLSPRDLVTDCRVTHTAEALLKSAMTRLRLTARAYHRILKIARTAADLEGSATIETRHVSEAVQYRRLERT
jgi:magnesium chelatase family protein